MGPVSFLTPLGSRSGAFAETRPRTIAGSGVPGRMGNSRGTLPYGDYFACEEFVSGSDATIPGKLNNFLRRISSGGTAPNIVQVSGVGGGLGIALKAGGSDTAYTVQSRTTGPSNLNGWTVVCWQQFIASYTTSSTSNGHLSMSNQAPLTDLWSVRFIFDNGTLEGRLHLNAGGGLLPPPIESHAVAAVGDWNFGAFRVNYTNGEVFLNINSTVVKFDTLIPASYLALGTFRTGYDIFSQISSGVRTAGDQAFTVGLDEIGYWPRYLSDAEIEYLQATPGDILTAPAWPNVPAFPR